MAIPVIPIVVAIVLAVGGVVTAPKVLDIRYKYQKYDELKEELEKRAPASVEEMEELRARIAELESEIRILEQAAEEAEEAAARREQDEEKEALKYMFDRQPGP